MAATVQHEAVPFVSNSGRTVTLRPCTPDDAPFIAAMYQCLSRDTLYMRYCSCSPAITGESEAARLCSADPEHRAVVLALCGGEVVGIGELGRVEGETAEIALLVRDDCQGDGMGTALALHMIGVARVMGVARIQAYTLPDNHAVRRIASKLPYTVAYERSRGELLVTVDISRPVVMHS